MAGHPDNGESFVYFRLLVRLPFVVSFPSVVYRLEVRSITMSARIHEITANQPGAYGYWRVCPSYSELEWLEIAVYEVGLRVRCVTVGEMIMRRLVREGQAAIVPKPADDLVTGRRGYPSQCTRPSALLPVPSAELKLQSRPEKTASSKFCGIKPEDTVARLPHYRPFLSSLVAGLRRGVRGVRWAGLSGCRRSSARRSLRRFATARPALGPARFI